jgi:hypothetical protein
MNKITLTVQPAKDRIRFAPATIRFTNKKKEKQKNACRTKNN